MRLMDRRVVLKGMVSGVLAAVGLPVLEAMLNANATALATGGAIPLKYGVWFWGVGANPEGWAPPTTGPGWTNSPTLSALSPVESYLSLVSGARMLTGGAAHYVGQAVALTGGYGPGNDQVTSDFGAPQGASTDQIVANAWGGQARLDSVVVGVSRAFQGGCLRPDATGLCTGPTHASWIGTNQPNYHEFSLTNFYNTLFGSSSDLHTRLQQKSVLDAVSQDMNALLRQVGTADQQRLDAHFQGIRDMETRLTATITCTPPALAAEPADPYTQEPLQQRNQNFSDMLALALSCNLTRVFTVQYNGRESDTIFWPVGTSEGLHTLTHDTTTDARTTVGAINAFTMGELSYFLQKLASTPDGNGNLLDNSSIYITSCIGDGGTHSCDRTMLQMIAGKAGGALTSGLCYTATDNDHVTSVAMTAMQAVGVHTGTPYGSNDAVNSDGVTAPIAALLA